MTKKYPVRTETDAQYQATFFRHSAVLSLQAVLLRKVPNDNGLRLLFSYKRE